MQLLNVLKGDMSIIGPRPLPIYEYEEVKAIADGDAEKIGELMKEAQNKGRSRLSVRAYRTEAPFRA